MRLRRMLAFVIDWNIALLPMVVVMSVLITFLQRNHAEPAPALVMLLMAGMIGSLALFVQRDAVCKGRSPGKRLFGLGVYDRETYGPATRNQLVRRNLFFFLCFIDGLILLFTGRTIGDRFAGTAVLTVENAAGLQRMQSGAPAREEKRGKGGLERAMLMAVAVVVFAAGMVVLIQSLLNAQKDTEEYKLAYSYLVSSEAFAVTGAEEQQIRLKSYSSHTDLSSKERTVKFGFAVNGTSFEVIGHFENDVWQVCEECTQFE